MLKTFIEHIQKTTSPQLVEVGGATFAVCADGTGHELWPVIDHPETLLINSLDALVKLVKTGAAKLENPLYITIPDHITVRCFGQPEVTERYHRQTYYEAKATDVPGWEARVQLPFEEMQIALRTRFQTTPDTPYVQKLLGEITTGAKMTLNDNGVATTIVTRKGIDLQANEAIRPIVKLRPYCTFQEVEQPESVFLIRVSERGITFIEADGGMWKLKARETVKAFLEDKLSDLVNDGGVLAIRRDIWKNAPFDSDSKNNLKGSSISKELCEYLSNLMKNGADASGVIKTTVDLKATDSTREYGFFRMWAALLTLEQYGKYQHIIPDVDNEWWLATPHTTPGHKNGNTIFVWCVGRYGIKLGNCQRNIGIRPALVFNPSLLVEYDDGEEESDDADREKALYDFYLRYVFDWSNFNSNHVGESPLSYEAWKVANSRQGMG